MDKHIVETYAGKRMDIRVVELRYKGTDIAYRYQVQYLFSRTKNTWKNCEHGNGGYMWDTLASAKAAARRRLRANNPNG